MGVLANGNSTRSVIYSSYLFQGRPNPCSKEVAQWLRREKPADNDGNSVPTEQNTVGEEPGAAGVAGEVDGSSDRRRGDQNGSTSSENSVKRAVRRLVVGHQPHADAPLVLHVNGVQVRKLLHCFVDQNICC